MGFATRVQYEDGIEIECLETPDGVLHLICRHGDREARGTATRNRALNYFILGQSSPEIASTIKRLKDSVRLGPKRVTG